MSPVRSEAQNNLNAGANLLKENMTEDQTCENGAVTSLKENSEKTSGLNIENLNPNNRDSYSGDNQDDDLKINIEQTINGEKIERQTDDNSVVITRQENGIVLDEPSENQVVPLNDINNKIDELLSNMLESSCDESEAEHPFLETMAEEGEEDTPSDDSNEIIEIGEEINTTESEASTNESYEQNSFIDDDENYQLLSGEEYDISLEDDKKRTRIIQLSSGSDDKIISLPKKKKVLKKRKKSRIIRIEDSSDEENGIDDINTNNTIGEEEKNTENLSTSLNENAQSDTKIYNNDNMSPLSTNAITDDITSDKEKDKLNKKIIILQDIKLHLFPTEISHIRPVDTVDLLPSVENNIEKKSLEENIFKFRKSRKKTKKRKRDSFTNSSFNKNEKHTSFGRSEVYRVQQRKKRKEYTKRPFVNILGEENVNGEKKRTSFFVLKSIDQQWKISKCELKPSGNRDTLDIGKRKKLGQVRISNQVNKFSPKDFKNLLINDPKRVKRMDTQRLLKKKSG